MTGAPTSEKALFILRAVENHAVLVNALTEQTALVDRLCFAVEREAEDIGGESSGDVLELLGPVNDKCRELLTALAAAKGEPK